jgi:hypothetical protein
MEGIQRPPMELRLQNRYLGLVKAHMHSAPATAAGPTASVGSATPLVQTQAMWRFLNNDRVGLEALIQPPRQAAREALERAGQGVVLLIHDWSKLDFRAHQSKHDTVQLTHKTDVGYELTTALAVSTADGSPLAPMQMHLKTSGQVYSTSDHPPSKEDHRLQQVLPIMESSLHWGLPARPVHVIDREADSVAHLRCWDARGHWFLVRADDRKVLWQGQPSLLSQIVASLVAQEALTKTREVEFKGRKAQQWVAETPVILHRPAKKRQGSKQRRVVGRPLELRLVIAQVRDDDGKVLATWMLLTNVSAAEAGAETIALWYYWRWRIESFFKLLKSGGQQIEYWQQETGIAIARRLLVAAMACVVVWDLERQNSQPAQEMKDLLIRLSGRQMKHGRPHTANALLAGLFVLLPMLELLETHGGDLTHIRQMARSVLPLLRFKEDV